MDAELSNKRRGEEQAARYANYFEIGHNAAEFILDFGQPTPRRRSGRYRHGLSPVLRMRSAAPAVGEGG